MKAAKELLAKPRTDAVTDGTEAKSVDELSDLINLINETAQRAGQQPQPAQEQAGDASAEEMAFLTRLMRRGNPNAPSGMQPGTTPGRGNLSGGTTDQAGRSVTGNASGRGAAGRIVNKAAGVIRNSPAEFRDALETYFRNVENPR